MPDDQDRISRAVDAAMDLAPDATQSEKLRRHCEWEVTEILSHIKMSDLSTSELLALLAVLCPVHSRALPNRPRIRPQDLTQGRLHSVI